VVGGRPAGAAGGEEDDAGRVGGALGEGDLFREEEEKTRRGVREVEVGSGRAKSTALPFGKKKLTAAAPGTPSSMVLTT